MELRGKTIVITGAKQGFAQELSIQLDAMGAHVFICDAPRRVEIEYEIEQILDRKGAIDILINSMARAHRPDFDIGFWVSVEACFQVLPEMMRRKKGQIINIASRDREIALPELLPYSAERFASVAFSEGLAEECLAEGIQVSTVIPGLWTSNRRMTNAILNRAVLRAKPVVTLGPSARLQYWAYRRTFPGLSASVFSWVSRCARARAA